MTLERNFFVLHGVPTNPDGSLDVSAAVAAAADDLWPHYLAVCDGKDDELRIAYLELLLSRTMRLLPTLTGQQCAQVELLRCRGERVILRRASATADVTSANQGEPEAPPPMSSRLHENN
jgi:hypothetical protein